jgi:hypothetical protein
MEKSTQEKASERFGSLLNAADAAEYLGFKYHKSPTEAVRYLCRCRRVKFIKIGRSLRFRKEWLDQFIENQAVEPLAS